MHEVVTHSGSYRVVGPRMADSAMNLNIGQPLRLLTTDDKAVMRSLFNPRSLLSLGQSFRSADSPREIWAEAAQFLEHPLGPCQIQCVQALPDDACDRQIASRQSGEDGAAVVTTIDDGYQVALPLYPGAGGDGWALVQIRSALHSVGDAVELIELVVFMAARECERIDNSLRAEQHENDLRFVHRIEQLVSVAPDVSSMGNILQVELSRVVENTFCAMLVVNDDPTVLEVVAYKRDDGHNNLGFHVPIKGSKAGSVFRSGQPLLVENVLEDEGAFDRDSATWRSLMIAPLLSGADVYGVIMVGHTQQDRFTERDLHIVELAAHHIGNAIYRMLDDERAQAQHRAVIETLAAAIDLRDPYTHTHSIRVAELSRRLALHLGFSERDAEQLQLAGLLHDIGKIGVPDRVLSKPGPLDPEERLIIMNHAELGATIVGRSPLLASLVPLVRHHHEWYDGRGYPDGLRGAELPIGAAILAVADAVETMTSNRVYRRALTVEQAKSELANGQGSQFHPSVAFGMLDLLETDPDVQQLVEDAPASRQSTSSLVPMNLSDVANVRVMQRIAAEIGTLTELDTFLEHVHLIVRDELDLADTVIWLFDEATGRYRLSAGNIDLPAPERVEPTGVRIEGLYVNSDNAVILGRADESGISDESVLFPMHVEDSVVGLIELVLLKPGEVAGRDVDLLHAIAAPIASTVRVAQLHDEAKRGAMTDGLTGVLNHRAFYEHLDLAVSHARDDEAVHLLIVDVIGLKAINDNFGHLCGDSVLRTVANAFVDRLRPQDVVARYGGDEFAAILRGSLDMPLDDIIAAIEQPVPCEVEDGVTLNVRLRCGSARSVDGDTRATELVARADSLLYQRVRPSARVVSH